MSYATYYYKDDIINIIHLAGTVILNYPKLIDRLENNFDYTDYNGDDYDIISCWNNDDICILKQQLDYVSTRSNGEVNIPLINCVPEEDFDKPWSNVNKIKYILDTLQNKCTKDIVIILDGFDVVINSFKDIKTRFLNSGKSILFNATTTNYPPNETVGIIDNIDSHWKYFNAGCCIGYREKLIEFYTEALSFIDIENPYNSEQLVIRYAFEQHKNTQDVMFEYDPNIFIIMSKTYVLKLTDNDFIIWPYIKPNPDEVENLTEEEQLKMDAYKTRLNEDVNGDSSENASQDTTTNITITTVAP